MRKLRTPLPLPRPHVSMMATLFQAPHGVTRRGSTVPVWRRGGGASCSKTGLVLVYGLPPHSSGCHSVWSITHWLGRDAPRHVTRPPSNPHLARVWGATIITRAARPDSAHAGKPNPAATDLSAKWARGRVPQYRRSRVTHGVRPHHSTTRGGEPSSQPRRGGTTHRSRRTHSSRRQPTNPCRMPDGTAAPQPAGDACGGDTWRTSRMPTPCEGEQQAPAHACKKLYAFMSSVFVQSESTMAGSPGSATSSGAAPKNAPRPPARSARRRGSAASEAGAAATASALHPPRCGHCTGNNIEGAGIGGAAAGGGV